MTGASIPYHLRPHKAVDRRLFVDLLGRIERWQPLADHVYLSMGAYPLEDHKLVHRILGLKKLISFDSENAVVARQKFNRPLLSCRCIPMKSGDVIQALEKTVEDCGFSREDGIVFWLDYTEPKRLGEQVREFQALLDKIGSGDVVRDTVNAQPLDITEQGPKAPVPVEELRARQFQILKSRINDFLPSWAKAEHMTAHELPKVISAAFGNAALKALPATGPSMFRPLSIVRYADGLQMLSMTGIVVPRAEENSMIERLDMDVWPFSSPDWETIHHLVVPDLTVRERLFLEREVATAAPDDIIASLGFDTAGEIPIADFIDTYRHYYRFYPTLLTSDL